MVNQPDPFLSFGGHIPGSFCTATNETRHYLQQRYRLVQSLLETNTTEAVQTALDHLVTIFQLSFRLDLLVPRNRIPTVMLRPLLRRISKGGQ